MSIFVIDLDKTNFGELLEVQHNQICNIEISSIRRASPFEEDVRDAVADFQPAVTGESVVECNPTEGESFCRAWTFEVFIQRGLRQGIGARPTITGHDEGRSIGFITHSVHQI